MTEKKSTFGLNQQKSSPSKISDKPSLKANQVLSTALNPSTSQKSPQEQSTPDKKATRRVYSKSKTSTENKSSVPEIKDMLPKRKPVAEKTQKNEVPKSTPAYSNSNNKTKRETSSTIKTKNPRPNTQKGKGKNTKAIEKRKTPVRIIPLGGLNEIGENITLYECGNDMFIVDCGLAFPDESMLGIDIVIPDFTYIRANSNKIRGIFLTHGHEDHIGGLAYLLKEVNVPVYGTKLTLGLVEGKLKEHGLTGKVKLNTIVPRQMIKAGCMSVEPIQVNHSIPDAVAYAIHTPAGVIIQTGDFKIDYTPIQGGVIDLARFGELGTKGVLALLADSTNSERPGCTLSERKVGQSLETLFSKAGNRRIIIASFASNIHRIQQIIDCAVKYKRKVVVNGRSMENVVATAMELGYLSVPKGVLIELDKLNMYNSKQIVVITTGSQGEPMAALSRMAIGEHRQITITSNDYIIISANPIPGNEKFVGRVVNELLRLGAEVIYEAMYDVHVSGHACQEEQKLMLSLIKPKFFIPVHGEYKHLYKHANTAISMGIDPKNVIIADNGKVIETDSVDMKIVNSVPAGHIMVDGLGVGDVGSIVLRDRKHLGQDGLIIAVVTIDSNTGELLAGPEIVSRGFVYVREAEELIEGSKKVVRHALAAVDQSGNKEWSALKVIIRDRLNQYIYQKTKRSPMILPVIMEV